MPILICIHICNSHQPTLKPKIAKDLALPTQRRRNNETLTSAQKQAGGEKVIESL
jgi:hypothetical protein